LKHGEELLTRQSLSIYIFMNFAGFVPGTVLYPVAHIDGGVPGTEVRTNVIGGGGTNYK
jgi:hypothetical protein